MREFHFIREQEDETEDYVGRYRVIANSKEEAITIVEWEYNSSVMDTGWEIYDMGEYKGSETSAFPVMDDWASIVDFIV